MAARARSSKTAGRAAEFVCPECGRTFARAAALVAYRRAAHGVAGRRRAGAPAAAGARGSRSPSRGKSSAARSCCCACSHSFRAHGLARAEHGRRAARWRRGRPGAHGGARSREGAAARRIDRDALLRALFPEGIPSREDVIRSINSWLNEAERLARTR